MVRPGQQKRVRGLPRDDASTTQLRRGGGTTKRSRQQFRAWNQDSFRSHGIDPEETESVYPEVLEVMAAYPTERERERERERARERDRERETQTHEEDNDSGRGNIASMPYSMRVSPWPHIHSPGVGVCGCVCGRAEPVYVQLRSENVRPRLEENKCVCTSAWRPDLGRRLQG